MKRRDNVITPSTQTMDYISPPHVSVIEVENSAERNHEEKTDISIKIILNNCFQWMKSYVKKWNGLHEKRPNRLSWDEHFWSITGSLISVILIAILHYRLFEK
jgi:hypothetical protein